MLAILISNMTKLDKHHQKSSLYQESQLIIVIDLKQLTITNKALFLIIWQNLTSITKNHLWIKSPRVKLMIELKQLTITNKVLFLITIVLKGVLTYNKISFSHHIDCGRYNTSYYIITYILNFLDCVPVEKFYSNFAVYEYWN